MGRKYLPWSRTEFQFTGIWLQLHVQGTKKKIVGVKYFQNIAFINGKFHHFHVPTRQKVYVSHNKQEIFKGYINNIKGNNGGVGIYHPSCRETFILGLEYINPHHGLSNFVARNPSKWRTVIGINLKAPVKFKIGHYLRIYHCNLVIMIWSISMRS